MRQGGASLLYNTYGKSSGRNGNYSTNYQISGRELLTPDEVRMLDNRYALLFVRGERPIMDEKFDILRHPNVGATTDGKGERFVHGVPPPSNASIVFDFDLDLTDGRHPTIVSEFILAKTVVTRGLELMMALFGIVQGLMSTIMSASGIGGGTPSVLPAELVTTIESVGFFESIPLWAVTLIGGLFIIVLSFIMIMSVYGRFFKLYSSNTFLLQMR